MAQTNQISAAIGAEDLADINAAIATIRNKLVNVLIFNLDGEDRQGLSKMGDKTLAFVDKSLEYANVYPNLVPGFLDIEEGQKDYRLSRDLYSIFQEINALNHALEDTVMIAGSEAFDAARIFYKSVQNAARSNAPGSSAIYEDLKARFPGKKGKAQGGE